jgi:pimeloyl-ACP methyl ester carboxylesterase
MGEGTAALAEALRAQGAIDVQTATVTQSGHWVAQEQPPQVASLINRFAAGSR